jgi:CheY-like chemotaxis protein
LPVNATVKKVLIADDDPVVLSVYREGLSKLGLEVETVGDGLAAVRMLQKAKPDILVLDLDMPLLSGVDVLKFIRSSSRLHDLPVIVLSNSYAQDLAREAAAVGAQKGLLKISCTPVLLAGLIGEIIDGQSATDLESHLLGVVAAAQPPTAQAQPVPSPAKAAQQAFRAPEAQSAPPEATPSPSAKDPETAEGVRVDFLRKAKRICTGLQEVCKTLPDATTNQERGVRFQDLSRRFEFLSASAEVVGCLRIAQMANSLRALLLGMMDKPGRVTPSALHTVAEAIDFLWDLVQSASGASERPRRPVEVLVVDDDQISNRLVVSSLRALQINAKSEFDPLKALGSLAEKTYHLVLLDIEMPGMDGVSFCRRLRLLPGYERTPVIFVTLHSDLETREKAIQSGGNDLIAKPIYPLELAVKVVMHLLKTQTVD